MTDCIVLDYRRTPDGDVCVQRKAHGGDCPGDACDGCLPTPTATGRICCERHEDAVSSGLQEFASLYAALAEPTTRTEGGTTRTEAEQDATPQALPAVVAARSQLKATLVTWCKVLEDDFGVPLPDERVIAQDTRDTILRRQWDVDIAIDGMRGRPKARPAPAERARLAAVADGHRRVAAQLREDRAAGVDVIRALAGHVDDHRPKLLGVDWAGHGHEHRNDGWRWLADPKAIHDCVYCGESMTSDFMAEERRIWQHVDRGRIFAEDILDVAANARRLVDRHRTAVRIKCSCGGSVPLDAEPPKPDAKPRTYRCNGCGDQGTREDWIRREAPAMTSQPMPLADLPDWLLRHHRLVVTLDQLRGWSRGERAAIVALPPAPGEQGGRTRRRLYDPVGVLAVARSKAERGRRSA